MSVAAGETRRQTGKTARKLTTATSRETAPETFRKTVPETSRKSAGMPKEIVPETARETAAETSSTAEPLGWIGVIRLGLVQAALGSIVVLVTSTLNRLMVVEYALPALLPGMLVALHYAVQMIRPRFGYGSDRGGRRTPWIVGGMAILAGGGVLCAVATVTLGNQFALGLILAVLAYTLVGLGVGAAGTSVLVLMAKRVDDRRRAAAATIMWILMIAGFAVTSTTVGHFLDPYSPQRLLRVMSIAAAAAFLMALAAIWKVEEQTRDAFPACGVSFNRSRDSNVSRNSRADQDGARDVRDAAHDALSEGTFAAAMRRAWSDPEARAFTLFVFVSMLAYSAQELLLEPFSGLVFGYSLGESARLSGSWHAAALVGMICVGIACSGGRRGGARRAGVRRFGTLRAWTIGGCCASAAALLSLVCACGVGRGYPLQLSVIVLGAANGIFAVSAIASMMELGARADARSAGVRMGLWGAAQAVAFALGGVAGTAIVDAFRWLFGSAVLAFAIVFGVEALLFFAAAKLASRFNSTERSHSTSHVTAVIA